MRERHCVHCGCSDSNACMLYDDTPCSWVQLRPPVCSNPECVKAEAQVHPKRAKASKGRV